MNNLRPVVITDGVRHGGYVPDKIGLEHRIAALRAEIAAAERKCAGIDDAITPRRKTLNRLQARLVLESGAAPSKNE